MRWAIANFSEIALIAKKERRSSLDLPPVFLSTSALLDTLYCHPERSWAENPGMLDKGNRCKNVCPNEPNVDNPLFVAFPLLFPTLLTEFEFVAKIEDYYIIIQLEI